MNLLYVIPRMIHGGGMPDVLAEVKTLREHTTDLRTTVVTLEPGVSTGLMTEALGHGLKVLVAPAYGLLARLVERADLTVVQYWNCPAMYRFFRQRVESRVPHRLVVNVKVNGLTLPQAVPGWVLAAADALIHAHPRLRTEALRPDVDTLLLPAFIRLPDDLPPPTVPDFGEFRLFYAGTLNAFKAHPDLVVLHEGLNIPAYHFDLWGAGTDAAFERDLAGAQAVRFRGFSRNLYADMEPYHLLCNPQAALSYGAFDKITMESQLRGKPTVVLKNSAVADHVRPGVNGLVAADEFEYRAALEDLAAHPAAYRRLWESTLHHAQITYRWADYAGQTLGLYERTLRREPQPPESGSVPENPETAALDGLGAWKQPLLDRPETLTPTERNFALRCEGGLIHYHKAFPDDEALKTRIQALLRLETAALA